MEKELRFFLHASKHILNQDSLDEEEEEHVFLFFWRLFSVGKVAATSKTMKKKAHYDNHTGM